MPNGEAVMVEVKGTPFQTDNLTAAQAVKSRKKIASCARAPTTKNIWDMSVSM